MDLLDQDGILWSHGMEGLERGSCGHVRYLAGSERSDSRLLREMSDAPTRSEQGTSSEKSGFPIRRLRELRTFGGDSLTLRSSGLSEVGTCWTV